MAKAPSFADRMSDPETQATASLKRIRYAPTGVEEATWAVAAAVFSLRDTMAEAMNAKAAAPAVTREAVAKAVSHPSGPGCRRFGGSCLGKKPCACSRGIDAVMKLLKGGE